MTRDETLARAGLLIGKVRSAEYGDSQQMHARIAAIWSAILGHPVTPWQVTLMMAGLKIARLSHAHQSEDGWVDAVGYLALGSELAGGHE